MLTALLSKSRQKVVAIDIEKTAGPFICPACEAPVILRKGLVRMHHFAHHTEKVCFYKGESQLHLKTKLAILNYIKKEYGDRIQSVEPEVFLGGVRPDIFLKGQHKNIAIEIQVSALSPAAIIERTARYQQLGIYVLWVLPLDPERFFDTAATTDAPSWQSFRLREYERIIAYMYFKNLTLWDLSGQYSEKFIVLQLKDRWSAPSEYYSLDWSAEIKFDAKRLKMQKEPSRIHYNVPLEAFVPSYAAPFKLPKANYYLPKRLILTYRWDNKP